MSRLSLSDSQYKFLKAPTKFRAYVGGFGSGKTFSGCLDLAIFALENPRLTQGYFAPTYPLIRDIFYPTMTEAAELLGMRTKIKESNKEVDLYIGEVYYGTIICRTMDNPNNIVGFKIARALCDEIDVMREDKATNAWNKIIARMRLTAPGVVNGIGVTTTPEGFKFAYSRFAKDPKPSYSMVQASTYENEMYLPPDYISSLKESYPDNLIDAYLNGQFVNLSSGTVYVKFDRSLNRSNEKWDGKEPLHIGMDFNVGRMCCVAHVIRNGVPHAIAEITGGYDTPEMIKLVKRRFWKEVGADKFEKTCQIYVYPDSSGKNRKSVGASETDISLLNSAGFICMHHSTNPPVKDRVNAMNAMFCNANNERKYFINTDNCPNYTEKLEQQVYNNHGEPEKDGTEDVNDAGGYFIAYKYPIVRPMAQQGIIRIGF